MKANLEQKLNLYVENVSRMKKTYRMQVGMLQHLGALLYTAEDKELDGEAIRHCHKLIKTEAGVLSYFRGSLAVGIATLLSLSKNPQQLLQRALEVYSIMKKTAGFTPSDYLSIAAYQIAAGAEPDRYADIISRDKEFYDGMKKRHWLLTNKEDYIFTAMLALTDIPVQTGLDRMEQFFQAFKEDALFQDRLHALSQVLVLSGENAASVSRAKELRAACHQVGWRLNQEYTYPILGVLSMMHGDPQTIARDIADACSFLRGQKGFGSLSLSKQELTMVAASIVAYTNVDEMKSGVVDSVLSTSIASIIVAQEVAVMAASVAVAASVSSSSASSSSK